MRQKTVINNLLESVTGLLQSGQLLQSVTGCYYQVRQA